MQPISDNYARSSWVSELEASFKLGVCVETLSFWREVGYLKPGTHWRSSHNAQTAPWKPEVIYHLRWCREEMEYWRSHDASIISEKAA